MLKVFFLCRVEYPMGSVFPLHFSFSSGNVCRSASNPSRLASDRRISSASSESLDMAEYGTVKMSAESSVKVASFDPQEDKNTAILRERTS